MNAQSDKPLDWIVVGGSYPGALVAWFKSKYPTHAVGAWSSSGVIHAVKDFKDFDKDIYTKTNLWGPECVKLINMITNYTATLLVTDAGTQEVA